MLALIFWNPRYQVELIFSAKSSKITLDQLKGLIFKSFRKEKHYWEEMCDFEELTSQIEHARSLEQLFAAFKEFNQY